MTPNNKKKKNEENVIKIHSLFKEEFIDLNYTEWNLTQKDISEIGQLKFGHMKYKECTFKTIVTDSFKIGKFGNVNILNCIYFMNEKKEEYFKKISFSKFNIEGGLFIVNLFKNVL